MTQLIPRKFDRNRFLVDVNLRCLNAGTGFKAHAIDLGEAGISVFSMRFIGPGQLVELEFNAERSSQGSKLLGKIANARVESDGNILGIEFARPLNPQEMQALRRPVEKSSP